MGKKYHLFLVINFDLLVKIYIIWRGDRQILKKFGYILLSSIIELGRARRSRTVYVLDEPTMGLHYSDVLKLLKLVDRLVDQGNTVLIIEHDPDILSYVDYLIELGPEGGPNGGEIIATGSPEEIKNDNRSKTAPFLEII